ncbi:MAG TPA: aldo/keto reductase, partial [Acidobacteriota bacterium]|nr:aldo/keto reductase [Acidobacteriota bacterium]
MKYRKFGRTGWQVSEIGYGMWGMGDWTGSDDEESMRSLERAVGLGCNFFDTAWAYGDGRSENLLGQLTRKHPDSKWPEPDWRNTYFGPENLDASVDRAEALRSMLPDAWTMPDMALRFILSNSDVS